MNGSCSLQSNVASLSLFSSFLYLFLAVFIGLCGISNTPECLVLQNYSQCSQQVLPFYEKERHARLTTGVFETNVDISFIFMSFQATVSILYVYWKVAFGYTVLVTLAHSHWYWCSEQILASTDLL